jgi:hypothetical protein
VATSSSEARDLGGDFGLAPLPLGERRRVAPLDVGERLPALGEHAHALLAALEDLERTLFEAAQAALGPVDLREHGSVLALIAYLRELLLELAQRLLRFRDLSFARHALARRLFDRGRQRLELGARGGMFLVQRPHLLGDAVQTLVGHGESAGESVEGGETGRELVHRDGILGRAKQCGRMVGPPGIEPGTCRL